MKIRNTLQTARLAAGAAMLTAFPLVSGAQAATSADGVGGLIFNAASDIANPVGLLVIATFYLTGFWLAFSGLLALAQTANSNGSHRTIEGLLKLLGSGLLCALPSACGVGVETLFNSGHYTGNLTTAFANHATQDCTIITGTAGITCAAQNIGTNVVPIFVEASFVLMFLFGMISAGMTIYAVVQSHNERGRPVEGWAQRVVIAFVMCNVPALFFSIESSLGIASPVVQAIGAQSLGQGSPPSMLSYTYAGAGAGGILASYQSLISWCFVILVMFGVISLWKGIMQLKAHAEGNKQQTLGSGIVHIVFGCLLANGKYSTCLILTSMLGNALGFC